MLPTQLVARFEPSWSDETLLSRADAVIAANANRVALIDDERALTFEELDDRARRLAGHLRARGVEPGDVISWQLPNWWEAAAVHLAAMRLGAVSNPVNPAFRDRELEHVTRTAGTRALITPAVWRGFDHATLTATAQIVLRARGGELDRLFAAPSQEAPVHDARPHETAVLLFTSGTTGEPKGVPHTHRALLYQTGTFAGAHALTPEDRYLGGPPVAHIAGLSYGILAPFALGTSTVLLDRWDRPRASRAGEHRPTFMTGPPTFLLTLAEHARDLESFRLFSTGGATIPAAAIRAAGAALGCSVKRAYGSTEIPFLTATAMDDTEHARLETDGRALGANEIRIAEGGEIQARGPGMFEGYVDEPLTDEWFATGDLGTIDEDGYLHVVGRLKDIIIRGGENISAKELEDLLHEHPSVADVAIVGMTDERLGERVCAVVVPRESFTFDDMIVFLTARAIAKHKLPERLELRDSLPRTDSGKIRKDALRTELG
ncbi:MAG: AMP-binding protein [Actinomycetota bacterium]